MRFRDMFTAEEWTEVTLAPMLAGFAVTAADPSGPVGLFREGSATVWSIRAMLEPEGTLASEIAAACEAEDGARAIRDAIGALGRGRTPAEASAAAIARLGEAARLVAAKAPGEADGFRAWISETAASVAEAAAEGGILGFGGEKVSAAERRTLAEIDAALGIPGTGAPEA